MFNNSDQKTGRGHPVSNILYTFSLSICIFFYTTGRGEGGGMVFFYAIIFEKKSFLITIFFTYFAIWYATNERTKYKVRS